MAVSAARLAIAAVILLAIALVRRSRIFVGARENRLLAIAGAALAVHFAVWIWSLQFTSVAVSTLLVTTTPIWAAIFDAVTGRRRLSRLAVAAFIVGAAGLLLVVGFDRTPPPQRGHEVLGAALALLGAFAIGAYLLIVREVRRKIAETRAIVTRTYGWAAVALVIGAVALRQPPPALNDTAAWGGIAAMALISQLLGHTALNASLRWFTPSAVSFATLLEPVFAAVLALAVFREPVPLPACGGAVILLAAIGVVLREERLDPAVA